MAFRGTRATPTPVAVLLEPKNLSETLLLAPSSDASAQLYDRITFFNPPNLLAPFVSAMGNTGVAPTGDGTCTRLSPEVR